MLVRVTHIGVLLPATELALDGVGKFVSKLRHQFKQELELLAWIRWQSLPQI